MQNNIFLLIIAILGSSVACIPLFRHAKRSLLLIFPAVLAVCMGYLAWGGYFALNDYQLKVAKEREINAMLASPQKTAALIKHIVSQLDDSPESAAGWVLVGKLYLVLHKKDAAKQAFEKAASLKR